MTLFPDIDRLVVHQFDPYVPVQGGIDTCISDLVKYAPDGFRFGIVGVTSERIPLGKWRTSVIFGREIAFMPVARLSAGDQARRVPHSLRVAAGFAAYVRGLPAVCPVQVHRLDTGAAVALRYPRCPRIQFIHTPTDLSLGRSSDSFWRHAPKAQAVLERFALRGASDVFVFSGKEAARLAEQGLPVTRCSTWFDPDIHFPSARTRHPKSVVVWVGRLERPKDPLLAVRTFAIAHAAGAAESLTIIGDGTLRPAVEEAIADQGLEDRITLEGAVSRRVVADHLRRADVALMTSHFEGSPRALIEALACGTPVCATIEADPDRLVSAGLNGCIAVSRDPEHIAAALSAAAAVASERCVESVAWLGAPVAVRQLLDVRNVA